MTSPSLPVELQLQVWSHYLAILKNPQLITISKSYGSKLFKLSDLEASSSWDPNQKNWSSYVLTCKNLAYETHKTHKLCFIQRLANPVLFNPSMDCLYFPDEDWPFGQSALQNLYDFCDVKGKPLRQYGVKRIAANLSPDDIIRNDIISETSFQYQEILWDDSVV
jgi:hypothetical protein